MKTRILLAVIAFLLALLLLYASSFFGAAIAAHLDADRADATKLRQLNTLCGGPKFKKISIGVQT